MGEQKRSLKATLIPPTTIPLAETLNQNDQKQASGARKNHWATGYLESRSFGQAKDSTALPTPHAVIRVQ